MQPFLSFATDLLHYFVPDPPGVGIEEIMLRISLTAVDRSKMACPGRLMYAVTSSISNVLLL
jgi:hypothetical protein